MKLIKNMIILLFIHFNFKQISILKTERERSLFNTKTRIKNNMEYLIFWLPRFVNCVHDD